MRTNTGIGPHLPRGVTWHEGNKKYRAQIHHEGHTYTLGYHRQQRQRLFGDCQSPGICWNCYLAAWEAKLAGTFDEQLQLIYLQGTPHTKELQLVSAPQ